MNPITLNVCLLITSLCFSVAGNLLLNQHLFPLSRIETLKKSKYALQAMSLSMFVGSCFLCMFDYFKLWALEFSLVNSIGYMIYIEFFHYMVHRLMHTKYLYNFVHKKHHEGKYDLCPLDTFVFSIYEGIWVTTMFFIPMYILPIHKLEFFIITSALSSYQFVHHSHEYKGFHYRHHIHIKCNYGLSTPFFDIVYNTYK